jgi:hypothetical protein
VPIGRLGARVASREVVFDSSLVRRVVSATGPSTSTTLDAAVSDAACRRRCPSAPGTDTNAVPCQVQVLLRWTYGYVQMDCGE